MTEKIVEEHRCQLVKYGEEHGLPGLDGRLLRGLDPAGMLAVDETRAIVQEKVGNSYDALLQLSNEFDSGAIWKYAEKLTGIE